MKYSKQINGIVSHCTRTRESYFRQYRKFTAESTRGRHIFLPRGGKVLAVAHLDTVRESSPTCVYYNPPPIVQSLNLDDRLGVWGILESLPIDADILLTEGEEVGRSTALDFSPSRDYNWIFSLDRRGKNHAVLYQYDSPSLRDMLSAVGIDTQFGSFSDISSLDHLGVAGINFAIGYYNEHTLDCFANVKGVMRNLENFMRFYGEYGDTKIPYTPSPMAYDAWGDGWYGNDPFVDYPSADYPIDGYSAQCQYCGMEFNPGDMKNGICFDCDYILNYRENGKSVRARRY